MDLTQKYRVNLFLLILVFDPTSALVWMQKIREKSVRTKPESYPPPHTPLNFNFIKIVLKMCLDVMRTRIAQTNLMKRIAEWFIWKKITKKLWHHSGNINFSNYYYHLIFYFFLKSFLFSFEEDSNIPVNINISIRVEDFIKIEEINHIFTLKVKIKMNRAGNFRMVDIRINV